MYVEWKVLVAQSCLTLCDPMDCSPPGSSIHGIRQARILEWVSMPSSRWSLQPRSQTCVSCIAGRFFTTEPLVKPPYDLVVQPLNPVWLCDPMDCRRQDSLSTHHYLPEFAQSHVHWVGDVTQLSYPLSSPSPSVFSLSQHQGLFQWVG